MPDDDPQDWSPKAVLDRLASSKDATSPVSVQLFLSEDVAGEDISTFVGEAADRAAAKLGISRDEVRIGRPFKLARSIGVVAPVEVVKEMMSMDKFIELLPSAVSNIMIKPVRKGR